ncbi:hypothetical protein FSP39_024399 [Pinctada imbricata]|uniref:FAD dependent oxidoreductase domain-containing protein n=1 Tax=Pinctada imbricata TaxID=66713 RepID=A0AA89BS33_PINIB|nr:hypothetical protein FSP39_024399 [Pinctada imbricata]
MSGTEPYECIVVGAGVEGSATAYYLAKSGCRTLLLEQFPLPHSRGSSHGQSRITRKAYGDYDHFTLMMKEAFPMWETLEKESGLTIYKQTGMLAMGLPDHSFMSGTRRCLKKHNIPYEEIDAKEMHRKYPMVSFPENFKFIIDFSGGILRADKALQAYHSQFKRYGGAVHDGEPVTNIYPGDVITVRTTKAEYKTKKLVLAVGAWASKILPNLGLNLPLQVVRISVLYWREKHPGEYSAAKFPVFYQENGCGKYSVYGLPSEEYPGLVKICLHWGPEVDPDLRDKADDKWVTETMCKYVSDYFPGLVPMPAVSESCMYTWVPGENFFLDCHPVWKNIVIGAGFSGHGFKLAPVVGKVLGELAMERNLSYDMTPFKIDRFSPKHKL